MRRKLGFIAAWAAATLIAVVVAAAAVGSVRSDVTDEPTALGSPEAAAVTSTVTSITTPDGVTTSTMDDSDHEAECEGDQPGCDGTTTTTDPSAVTSTTEDNSTSSTSTTTASASTVKTVDTEAGSVTFVVSNGEVSFGGAVASPGWHVEVETEGTREVTVKFETNDDTREIRVKGQMEDGTLKVTIRDETD